MKLFCEACPWVKTWLCQMHGVHGFEGLKHWELQRRTRKLKIDMPRTQKQKRKRKGTWKGKGLARWLGWIRAMFKISVHRKHDDVFKPSTSMKPIHFGKCSPWWQSSWLACQTSFVGQGSATSSLNRSVRRPTRWMEPPGVRTNTTKRYRRDC